MNEFIAKFQGELNGVISGFDRLVFQGHLRTISRSRDMQRYLSVPPENHVLLRSLLLFASPN